MFYSLKLGFCVVAILRLFASDACCSPTAKVCQALVQPQPQLFLGYENAQAQPFSPSDAALIDLLSWSKLHGASWLVIRTFSSPAKTGNASLQTRLSYLRSEIVENGIPALAISYQPMIGPGSPPVVTSSGISLEFPISVLPMGAGLADRIENKRTCLGFYLKVCRPDAKSASAECNRAENYILQN